MWRLVIVCALLIGLAAVPVASVYACSCVGFASPAEAIAGAEVAFVGTVVDAAPGGEDPSGIGPTVRYAFEVERASVNATPLLEVRALDDPGGAACGITFGLGERWFITASTEGGSLSTGLCSGNLVVEGMAPDELERVMELLPVAPAGDPEPIEPATPQPSALVPVVVGVLGVIGITAVMVVAFRRER